MPQFNITQDYARHLLQRNGVRARVRMVSLPEAKAMLAEERGLAQRQAQEDPGYRLAAATEKI